MGTFSERLERLLALDHDRVGERGKTIARVYEGRTPRAFVLLHGLSASPAQFERFAEDLFARGHNVVVPRLPRHGHANRLSTALERITDGELVTAASEVIAIGRELGERVTVAGFSLGGLLASYIAQHEPVDRVVAIAPFYGVAMLPSRVMSAVAETLLKLPNRFAWWDPIARERQMPEHGYPRYSTHAIAHAYRVARKLFADAAANAPLASRIVLVHNASESAVNNRAIRRLYRAWDAAKPGMVELIRLGGLPPSHDIVEPLHPSNLAERVYPKLLDAIDPPD